MKIGSSSDTDEEKTEGTIVPGTQINSLQSPCDAITARSQCHPASMLVDPPCMLGIDPNHENLIRKTMHDDWGIDSLCCIPL